MKVTAVVLLALLAAAAILSHSVEARSEGGLVRSDSALTAPRRLLAKDDEEEKKDTSKDEEKDSADSSADSKDSSDSSDSSSDSSADSKDSSADSSSDKEDSTDSSSDSADEESSKGDNGGVDPNTENLRDGTVEGEEKLILGDKPGARDTDSKCGEWKLGTATGYSTDGTDKGDLPMAPNDLGEYITPGKFFKAANVLAVDFGDWEETKYRNIEVSMNNVVGTVQVWDFCNDKDCAPGNEDCCSTNKKYFKDGDSGFLLDVETHAAKAIWGLENAQNWLVAPMWYRVCDEFDHKAAVEEFDMECVGVDGDRKCE